MIAALAKVAAISVAAFFLIALTLVYSQAPPERPEPAAGSVGFGEAIAADYSTLPERLSFTARDGVRLDYRRYEGGSDRLVVLIHGSAWHGMQFHSMATALAARGLGTVVAPDLRGHGLNPVRRGDVDYVGQFEDDLADLINVLKKEDGYRQVVVGGHSSGGGLAVRFAGGAHGVMADAFVLMAPFLKYNAPTTRPNSGGWAHPATRPIIGLTMLDMVGITALNHLPVISFAMPRAVLDGPYGGTATTSYSFRLNTSFAPRSDYEKDLAAMRQPFLLVAGAADEAFFADKYAALMAKHAKAGTYVILPGVSHIGVTTETVAIEAVASWLAGLPLP